MSPSLIHIWLLTGLVLHRFRCGLPQLVWVHDYNCLILVIAFPNPLPHLLTLTVFPSCVLRCFLGLTGGGRNVLINPAPPFLFLSFFQGKVSYSPSWPWAYCVTEDKSVLLNSWSSCPHPNAGWQTCDNTPCSIFFLKTHHDVYVSETLDSVSAL